MAETTTDGAVRGHRIDIVETTQRVRVEIDGVELADTRRPTLLREGSLPVRFYIPASDVRMDLLTPTATRTKCPFKGEALYWSAKIGDKVYDDVVWSYPQPIPESSKIANLMCFFNERVDIYVDGEKHDPGTTPWSD